MAFPNVYFVNGTAYAGKSTMVRMLAEKHGGVACGENYHDRLLPELDPAEFPCLCWSRDLEDWHDFIRRSPEEYEAWYDGVTLECERLELRILEELHFLAGEFCILLGLISDYPAYVKPGTKPAAPQKKEEPP